MPMQTVTLRRWEIAAAFVALTAAFVVVAIFLSHANHRSGNAALQARAAALQAKAAAEQASRVAESNRRAVERLRRVKVNVGTLERGQCKLKAFLLSTAGVRTRLATHETDPAQRRKDLHAAAIARQLGRSFSNERCR